MSQLQALDRVVTMLAALRAEIEPPEIAIAPSGQISVKVVLPDGDSSAAKRCAAVTRIAGVLGIETQPIETTTMFYAAGNGAMVRTTVVPHCDACGAVKHP